MYTFFENIVFDRGREIHWMIIDISTSKKQHPFSFMMIWITKMNITKTTGKAEKSSRKLFCTLLFLVRKYDTDHYWQWQGALYEFCDVSITKMFHLMLLGNRTMHYNCWKQDTAFWMLEHFKKHNVTSTKVPLEWMKSHLILAKWVRYNMCCFIIWGTLEYHKVHYRC